MSILSAIKETRHESDNLTKLAKLPQVLIMGMAQRGEIEQDMLMPILGKKAEMAEQAAKMKAAETLAAQGGTPPTVMDNLMGRIAAAENPAPEVPPMPQQQMQGSMPQQMAQGPEDVGIASQMTAPMQLAGGGIIAFDEGGDVETDEDDEYQEMLENAQEEATNERLYEMLASLQSGVGSSSKEGASERRSGEGDLESRLRAAIMQRESGGRRYGKDGNLLTSSKGALGEMQVMPATARDPGFGIKAARDSSPDELRRVGDEYSNMLLNRYGDPKLAMIAYNMGPGATDKWLASGADIKKLPKETQGYIRGVNLAKGGEVPGYYGGGTMEGFGDALYDREEEVEYDPYFAEGMFSGYTKKAPKSQVDPRTITKRPSTDKKAEPAKKTEVDPLKTEGKKKDDAPLTAPPGESPRTPYENNTESNSLMDYIKRQEARMESGDIEDKNMAGLAAGLAILGGTSPYALENIGKGGLAGVQQLSNSRRTRSAREAALGKLYGSAVQSDAINRIRRDQLNQTADLARERADQSLLTAKNSFIEKRLKAKGLDEMMLGTLRREKNIAAAQNKQLDPKKQATLDYYENAFREIEADAERKFSNPRETTGFSARKIG
jgi:hypothetical protein